MWLYGKIGGIKEMNTHREKIKMELRIELEYFIQSGDYLLIEDNIARYRKAFGMDAWLNSYLSKYQEKQEDFRHETQQEVYA